MQLALIVIFCYTLVNAASADDLLELGCTTDEQCKQFERSSCRDSHCFCTGADSDKRVACKPKDRKLSNIIGGPCTQEHACSQDHAECDAKTQLCYCAAGFIPSEDRRRCLPQLVPLDGRCELTSQCQSADKSAVCHQSQKSCLCKAHFEPHNGRCLATLDLSCINDTTCQKLDAICVEKLNKCACTAGLVHNHNMTHCMPSAVYGASCTTNAQCQLTLGVDAICSNNSCSCRSKYYPKIMTQQEQNQVMNTTSCEPIVTYGAYCHQDKDCQQQQEKKQLSNLTCKYAECVCQQDYHVVDNEKCVLNAASARNPVNIILAKLMITTQFFWHIYSRIRT
ncbi:zonadhesin [Drosophila innubila]|uniref:zonadhesin n=1 Tax=Drosophila innubila TaxID=198719 RepID=UPI00148CBAFE|nr:zonadhesin [Drosophila innubila]